MLHLLPRALRSINPVPTVVMMSKCLLCLANSSLCLGTKLTTCANTDVAQTELLSLVAAAAVSHHRCRSAATEDDDHHTAATPPCTHTATLLLHVVDTEAATTACSPCYASWTSSAAVPGPVLLWPICWCSCLATEDAVAGPCHPELPRFIALQDVVEASLVASFVTRCGV